MAPPKGHAPYSGCETGGRPKIYTQEFIEREADELNKWVSEKKSPFIEDFCLERGYLDRRVNEWRKENEKMNEAYERFRMRQRVELYKGGLSKKYSYPMCALLLSHHHDVIPKTEKKITGSISDPLAFILDHVTDTSEDLIDEPTDQSSNTTSL